MCRLLMSIVNLSEPPSAPELGEDFPIICESCLGPNPYTRMMKTKMAKECRISDTPFTAFRWQGALRRWKETIVCAAVAREKNICQSCLNDLEYGVPFNVRDHVMNAIGEEQVPGSDVNREFTWANKRQKQLDAGADAGGYDTYEKLHGHIDRLRELAAIDPGPVVWRERREEPLSAEEQARLKARRQAELRPPVDKSVTSLFIGGVPPAVDRKQLLPFFLPYGEVRELVVDSQRLMAIATFRERAAAETACASLRGNLTVHGSRLRVSWARRKGQAADRAAPTTTPHDHYGEGSRPPPAAAAASRASSATPSAPPAAQSSRAGRPALPPGVRLPPGVKAPAYPSMDPGYQGTNPEKH